METRVLNGMVMIALLAGVSLAGCGGGKPEPGGEPAAVAADQAAPKPAGGAAKDPAPLPAAEQAPAGGGTPDLKRGKTLFLQCRACHSLEEGGAHKVGPNLHGVFGRAAGQAEGFAYSDVLKDSGVVWTDDTMDQWIERPADFLPGNRMVFIGIRKPEDRASLIAYMKQETGATQ